MDRLPLYYTDRRCRLYVSSLIRCCGAEEGRARWFPNWHYLLLLIHMSTPPCAFPPTVAVPPTIACDSTKTQGCSRAVRHPHESKPSSTCSCRNPFHPISTHHPSSNPHLVHLVAHSSQPHSAHLSYAATRLHTHTELTPTSSPARTTWCNLL